MVVQQRLLGVVGYVITDL